MLKRYLAVWFFGLPVFTPLADAALAYTYLAQVGTKPLTAAINKTGPGYLA